MSLFLTLTISILYTVTSIAPPGSVRDKHGCIPSAGYQWCAVTQKCYRSFEENCVSDPNTATNTCGGFTNCIAYYDGCNTCNCISGTGFASCTERFCAPVAPGIRPPEPRCTACMDGYTLNPTTNECEVKIEQNIIASCGGFPNCNSYSGGCDSCWCGVDGTDYPICSGCAPPPPGMLFPAPHCTACIDGYILDPITNNCEMEPCLMPPCVNPCGPFDYWPQTINGQKPYCDGYPNTRCQGYAECNKGCYAKYFDTITGQEIVNCVLVLGFPS